MAPLELLPDDRGRAGGLVRAWRSWAPTSITAVAYTALLAGTVAVWSGCSPAIQQAWLAWASSNAVNLRTHPVRCLLASAFVTDDRPLAWVALGLVGLSAAGRALGNLRTALLVAGAHVLATLVTEGLLAARIATGARPVTERLVIDVGPSYVVVSALAAGIGYGSWPVRAVAAVAFIVVAPFVFGGLFHGNVWAVGHAAAVLSGLGLGLPLHRSWRRRRS